MKRYGIYALSFAIAVAMGVPAQANPAQESDTMQDSALHWVADNDGKDRKWRDDRKRGRNYRENRQEHSRGDRDWRRGDREDRGDQFDRKRPDRRDGHFGDDRHNSPGRDHRGDMGRMEHRPGSENHRPGEWPGNGRPEFPGRR